LSKRKPNQWILEIPYVTISSDIRQFHTASHFGISLALGRGIQNVPTATAGGGIGYREMEIYVC
jgi:hypothetical protein